MDSALLVLHIPPIVKIASVLLGLIIIWIIVSIPVFISARIIVGRRAGFGEAMLATLVGPIVFGIILTIGYVINQRVFTGLGVIAFLLGFIAWIAVYRVVFHTGWIRAFGIAVLAIIVALIVFVILALIGLAFKDILTTFLAFIPSMLG
jgi:hypothetical protein